MKSYARIGLSCLLAAMLMSPLMACGSKEGESSGPKKDMATETREQLKELAKSDERLTGDLENKTIKWMSDWDINSDDTGKTTPVELAVFQERYGGKVEFHQTTYANRYDDLANAINSDEGIDFFYGGNWDAFQDMLSNFVDTSNEHYGIDSWYFESGLSASTGVPYVGLEDGKLVNNLRNEAIEDYQNWMYDLWQSDYIALGVGDYGWTSRDYYIGEGKLLFYPCGLWTLSSEKSQWSKTFGEDVFFVPVPQYDKADAYYIPTNVNAYCFVKGGHNPEGVGKFMDCFRFSKVSEGAQQISDQQFRDDYEWTDEMIDMKNKMNEMALEHPVFDYYNGISTDVTSVLDSSEHGVRAASRGVPWTESVNSIYDQIQNYIDEVNETQTSN